MYPATPQQILPTLLSAWEPSPTDPLHMDRPLAEKTNQLLPQVASAIHPGEGVIAVTVDFPSEQVKRVARCRSSRMFPDSGPGVLAVCSTNRLNEFAQQIVAEVRSSHTVVIFRYRNNSCHERSVILRLARIEIFTAAELARSGFKEVWKFEGEKSGKIFYLTQAGDFVR